MTTLRTTRQLTCFKRGTKVIAPDGVYVGAAPLGNKWTVQGVINGHLVLEGRTADKCFVPMDTEGLWEVVR